MRSDPRIWLIGVLAIVGMAVAWLLSLYFLPDAIWRAFGFNSHAITFMSIFVMIAGFFVARLFYRYAKVKADLLAGRNVIARWHVSASELSDFAVVADERDRSDKRSALLLVWFFLIVIFGAFAIYDREVALPMMLTAAGVGLLVTLAYWLGGRVRSSNLQRHSGDVIVSSRGLLVNDVLHVWSAPLSWLRDVRLEQGPPAMLIVTYAFQSRYGAQEVDVMLPIPADRMSEAAEVARRLPIEGGKWLRGQRRRRSTTRRRHGLQPRIDSKEAGLRH